MYLIRKWIKNQIWIIKNQTQTNANIEKETLTDYLKRIMVLMIINIKIEIHDMTVARLNHLAYWSVKYIMKGKDSIFTWKDQWDIRTDLIIKKKDIWLRTDSCNDLAKSSVDYIFNNKD